MEGGASAPWPPGYSPDAVVVARDAVLCPRPRPDASRRFVPLGTRLRALEVQADWAHVGIPGAVEGWMPRATIARFDDLSPGPLAAGRSIVRTAMGFLGAPYLWGGRTIWPSEAHPSGVDCSGLVNLAYRADGRNVPRDAVDQAAFARPLTSFSELRPGDAVFLAPSTEPGRVSHVLLYAGRGQAIEASQETGHVRRVSLADLLQCTRQALRAGVMGRQVVSLGRLLRDE
jgi:hypothetical protein